MLSLPFLNKKGFAASLISAVVFLSVAQAAWAGSVDYRTLKYASDGSGPIFNTIFDSDFILFHNLLNNRLFINTEAFVLVNG